MNSMPADESSKRLTFWARSGLVEGAARVFDLWGTVRPRRSPAIERCTHVYDLTEVFEAAALVRRAVASSAGVNIDDHRRQRTRSDRTGVEGDGSER